ncbi:hypothetical protein SVIOM342S_03706 [Streptomyces violaceorubidus]
MPTSAPPSNRFERRRAETRQSLVRAARQILADTGDTGASIQAIAERADVGFGSFYNHFASKAELFDAAVVDALEEFGQAVDEHLRETEDPAELVAAGVEAAPAQHARFGDQRQLREERGESGELAAQEAERRRVGQVGHVHAVGAQDPGRRARSRRTTGARAPGEPPKTSATSTSAEWAGRPPARRGHRRRGR